MDLLTEIPVNEDDDALARWVWKNLVNNAGQSAWVQGELLRSVEKLSWEAKNNGNINWDYGFTLIADYLETTLCEEPAFTEATRQSIRVDISTLRDYTRPYTEDELYERLISHVVAYCRLHPALIPKPHNPELTR